MSTPDAAERGKFLIPTDYSEGSNFALDFAGRTLNGGELIALHVCDVITNDEVERLDTWLAERGVDATPMLRAGHPPDEIAKFAAEEGCEAIIMHEGKFGLLGMGSTSKRVVGQATVTVRVLRDHDGNNPIDMNLHGAL